MTTKLSICEIVYFGRKCYFCCDKKCDKAWGGSERPIETLSADIDDFEWLSDTELGDAPEISPTTEGGDNKPMKGDEVPNRWCVRECERGQVTIIPEISTIQEALINPMVEFNLPWDFSKRVKNIKDNELEAENEDRG